jgi:hypothetical protein
MPHGITLSMIQASRLFGYRAPQDRPARERDRSLRGKARIAARRAAKRSITPADAAPRSAA